MDYYYTDIYVDDDEPIKIGLGSAFDLAITSGSNQLNILVDNIGVLDGSFSEIIGEKLTNKFVKEKEIYEKGVLIRLLLGSNKYSNIKGIVFGLEVKLETLSRFIENNNIDAVVYCPLHDYEYSKYEQMYTHAVKL